MMMRHLTLKLPPCTALVLFALCLKVSAPAQVFTILAEFSGTDGANPQPLTQGTDGNFYGPARLGGPYPVNSGTIFVMGADGTLTTLYDFCPVTNCPDGERPIGPLIQASDGNFYGTTTDGGLNLCSDLGCGTIFRITPGGTLTTLYSFCSEPNCSDGSNPMGGLLLATNGTLYGTTYFGGSNNYGTVFSLMPTGQLTTLFSFDGSNGAYPQGALIQATDGNFYGTTYEGGAGDQGGTAFRITASGTLTTIYNFCSQTNCTDGYAPYGLVQARNGSLYGTTSGGGLKGDGTIYEITPQGVLTTIHSFTGPDGSAPNGSLAQGTDGLLYGTTYLGSENRAGTIFRVNLKGILSTILRFGSENGGAPNGGLVQGTDGLFYGTTNFGGGPSNTGFVYSLNVGLPPFVALQHSSGRISQTFGILGQGFTGATNVSFNSVPAAYVVKSDTYLTATVPAGATTGYVTVTTPSGMLTSNVPFRVIP